MKKYETPETSKLHELQNDFCEGLETSVTDAKGLGYVQLEPVEDDMEEQQKAPKETWVLAFISIKLISGRCPELQRWYRLQNICLFPKQRCRQPSKEFCHLLLLLRGGLQR